MRLVGCWLSLTNSAREDFPHKCGLRELLCSWKYWPIYDQMTHKNKCTFFSSTANRHQFSSNWILGLFSDFPSAQMPCGKTREVYFVLNFLGENLHERLYCKLCAFANDPTFYGWLKAVEEHFTEPMTRFGYSEVTSVCRRRLAGVDLLSP